MMSESRPLFPIRVLFEDGSIDTFDSVSDLETNLEVFNSDLSPNCAVTDALGRKVRLRIDNSLVLQELALLT